MHNCVFTDRWQYFATFTVRNLQFSRTHVGFTVAHHPQRYVAFKLSSQQRGGGVVLCCRSILFWPDYPSKPKHPCMYAFRVWHVFVYCGY